MRGALYARVSTVRQAQGQTIEQQLTLLQAALTQHGWTLDPRYVFRDEGYSAAHLGRPALDHFCSYNASLGLASKWARPRTPAMAAGPAQHRWSVDELLRYQMPPARWRPPKRRGRRSKELQQLIERWAA